MMNRNWKLALVAAVAATSLGTGCTTIRTITAQTWVDREPAEISYIAYWEGKQGFGKGDTRVMVCHIARDNSVGCKNQKSAETALNVKGAGKGKVQE